MDGFEVQQARAQHTELWASRTSINEALFVAVAADRIGFVSLSVVLERMRQADQEREFEPLYDELFVLAPGKQILLKVDLVIDRELNPLKPRLLVMDSQFRIPLFTSDLYEEGQVER